MFEAFDNSYAVLFFIIFISVIGLCLIYIIIRWLKDRLSPKAVTKATVTDKRIQTQYVHHRRRAVPGWDMHKMNIYCVVFQLKDGSEIELRVPKSEYFDLQKDVQGQLAFRGKHYIGFQVENGSENA